MAQKKWYVVWQGYEPGVYDSWADCQRQVVGYKGAKFKSFPSQTAALRAYEDGAEGYARLHGPSAREAGAEYGPDVSALSVDAACSGNPGVMEYRGVWVGSKELYFHAGPYPKGTNNIGEFLAIVHALALLHRLGMHSTAIYSDSVTAIGWIAKKRCKTLLQRDDTTQELLERVHRAEQWLLTHTYTNPILKWDTDQWGEIPSDFGRK